MKKSELKLIIRECIEEIVLNEKSPHRPRLKGNPDYDYTGMRQNTLYGRPDRLDQKKDYPVKSNFSKKMISKLNRKDSSSRSHEASPLIDKNNNLQIYKPKSSFKKSGVGKTKVNERAPKRTSKTDRPNLLTRPNTVYGGDDKLKHRSDIVKHTKKLPVDQSYKNAIVKGYIKKDRRNAGGYRSPYTTSGLAIPKSSFKKSGVGK